MFFTETLTKQYRKANSLKRAQYQKEYRKNKPQSVIENEKLYEKKRNKTLKRKLDSIKRYLTYKNKKLQSCPKWLSDEYFLIMENFYLECRKLTLKTGIKHEVDHIIPLNPRNKKVCGLHVPWNLQIITREQNRKKSDSN